MKFRWVLLWFLSINMMFAQGNCMEIGTNFHFFGAGIYKDLKLSSTEFFTRNSVYLEDDNDWDSGLARTMSQDASGYPLEVPFTHPVTGEDQIVAFTIGGYDLNYTTGNYVMLYEGEGVFEFVNWTGATVTSITDGRIEFSIDYVDNNGIHIEILQSTLGNHVRNIRVVAQIYESNYLSEPFLPNFESLANEFIAFRYMDWSYTNNHPAINWAERTQANFHTQSVDNLGMAWEHMILMANYFNKDIWINVPHLADLDYIIEMATLFRDQLNPNLTIYLEYSNECWNWIFDQTHWLDENGPYPASNGTNYGYYSLQVFEAWESVFSGQESRLKTVLAGHDYFVIAAMDFILGEGEGNLVDLVSYPGYVGLNEDAYVALSAAGSSADAELVDDLFNNSIAENVYWMEQFKILVADEYDKEFVMYEGGQHITPEYFGLEADYNQALYDYQQSTEMGEFYTYLLNYAQETLEVTLFMNYVLASYQESAFGSWGLIENYFVEGSFPPKWEAVMDFKTVNNCSGTTPVLVQTSVCLEGLLSDGWPMEGELLERDLVPNSQPYNSTPWNYPGTENLSQLSSSVEIIDWVLVELRDPNTEILIETRVGILTSDGTVRGTGFSETTGLYFYNVSEGEEYKIAIRHRNHLDVISSNSVTVPNSNYDFCEETNVEDGNNQLTTIAGTMAMKAGDLDGDGYITTTDYNYYQTVASGLNTYISADCNLDGHVTVNDFNHFNRNIGAIAVSALTY